jgi:hypothetical protein
VFGEIGRGRLPGQSSRPNSYVAGQTPEITDVDLSYNRPILDEDTLP